MKKLLAVLLALVMVFTFMTPALATENDASIGNSIMSGATNALSFFEILFNAIHSLVHQLSERFDLFGHSGCSVLPDFGKSVLDRNPVMIFHNNRNTVNISSPFILVIINKTYNLFFYRFRSS